MTQFFRDRDLAGRFLGAVLFGLLIWLALPHVIVVLDDDFWYLRSVGETFRRGRPWTDFWQAPWAATSSCLVALVFAVTASMKLAVHGLLFLSAAMVFFGLSSFAGRSGLGAKGGSMVAFLVLSGPTTLFMLMMFTSVPFYWGCLWLAAWLALTKRWGWFAVVFCLGLGARQSALTWLALPGWAFLSALILRGRGERIVLPWKAFFAVVTGLLMLVILKAIMNPTHAQEVIFGAMGETIKAGRIPLHANVLVIGTLVVIGGYGLGCLAHAMTRWWRTGGFPFPKTGWLRLLSAFLALCSGAWLAFWLMKQLSWSHGCYLDKWAPLIALVTGGLAGAGLVLWPRRPSWGFALAALGALVLAGLYGGLFDYYFADLFFWGLAASLAGEDHSLSRDPAGTTPVSRFPTVPARSAVLILVLILAAWNFRCYCRHKYESDRVAACIQMTEGALRKGVLKPHEIGFASFGYLGWHLEDYYITHDGLGSADLGGFMAYRDDWNGERGTSTLSENPKSFRAFRDWFPSHNNKELKARTDALLLAEIEAPILWFWKAKFFLMRVPGEGVRLDRKPVDYDDFQFHPFPLNDLEWSQFMNFGNFETSP